MNSIRLPRTFAEWQQAGPQLEQLERAVNSLLNLKSSIRLPDGTILTGAVQMSGSNAVLFHQPFGQGGAQVVANNPITSAPSPLNQAMSAAAMQPQVQA